MTPLKVKMKSDPFEDNDERGKIRKYLEAKATENSPSDVRDNDKYCGIDLRWQSNGKFWAVEVAKTELWPIGSIPFSGKYFEIPLRKWKYMSDALYGKNVCIYDCGMYCILSHDLTHSVIFNMKDLLKINVEDPKNHHDRVIWGKTVRLVKISPFLIKKYVKM